LGGPIGDVTNRGPEFIILRALSFFILYTIISWQVRCPGLCLSGPPLPLFVEYSLAQPVAGNRYPTLQNPECPGFVTNSHQPRSGSVDGVGYGGPKRNRPMANAQLDAIIRAYLQAHEAKDEATKKYNQLRDELMEVLDAEGIQRYTGAFAKLTVCQRKVYGFPAEVILAKELAKAQEQAAIKTGAASVVGVTRYPKVTVTE